MRHSQVKGHRPPARRPHCRRSPSSAHGPCKNGLRPKLREEFLQLHSDASGETVITGQRVKGYRVSHL